MTSFRASARRHLGDPWTWLFAFALLAAGASVRFTLPVIGVLAGWW